MRKVKTASGATAVQIVEKRNGRRHILEHVGSAHDDAELAILISAAKQRLHGVQPDMLPLEPAGRDAVGPVVEYAAAEVLWSVLAGAYRALGFDQIDDEVFALLVGGRLVEPTSKVDTIRVLTDLGLPAPHRNTIYNCLRRCVQRDYRSQIAAACWSHVTASRSVALVMYDVTTLHFEVTDEDQLRKVGMSKEHRIDPQVSVGLLVDGNGFPLEIAMFEGNKAETKTIIPVIEQFKARHGVKDLVVVADAGMLSAANLNALEDAGYCFIVGSRQSRVPYDLGDHFERHGNYVPDGATIETSRDMGTGKDKRTRRVVYHYSFKRRRREERAINAQVTKAEKVAAGQRPVARDRFVTVTTDTDGKKAEVNWDVIKRARFCAGFKGYVTNIDATVMDGSRVVTAYHDLWRVEESFRMTKSDLAARPIFHRKQDSIEAHLTVVFTALAVARYLQARTGVSIKRLVRTLRPLQTVTITIAGHQITAQPRLDPETAALLETIRDLTGH